MNEEPQTQYFRQYAQYATKKARLVRMSDVNSRAVDWILPGYLARKRTHILAGQPGVGKSSIINSIIARVTHGGSHPSWPGQKSKLPGNVIVVDFENDLEDTARPQLEAAGADLSRVRRLEGTREFGRDQQFQFSESDFACLEQAAIGMGGVDLIVIDPVMLAIRGDSGNNANVQRAMDYFAQLAVRLNCAILCVVHLVKLSKGRDLLSRLAGAGSFGSSPRGVMLVVKNQSDSAELDGSFVLVRAKSSGTATDGGFGYDIAFDQVSSDFGPVETSKIVWRKVLLGSADEIVRQAESGSSKAKVKGGALSDAVDFLTAVLSDGPLSCPEVLKMAEDAGIAKGTLMRAKLALHVISEKQVGSGQFSSFMWRLP